MALVRNAFTLWKLEEAQWLNWYNWKDDAFELLWELADMVEGDGSAKRVKIEERPAEGKTHDSSKRAGGFNQSRTDYRDIANWE